MLNEYINLKYKPNKDDLICCYYLEPAKNISFEKAATNIAGESSIDTWSDILTLNPKIARKYKPNVFYLNKKNKIIKIAYHSDLFEINSIPQILSSIAGNILSINLVNNLKLLDISIPKKIIRQFKGPEFGLKGIRKSLNIYNRPLIGTIVKPKLGLNSQQHAKVAYNAFLGGCDLVKDDENLTNQNFNQFKRRVKLILDLARKAEKQTKETKSYIPNITSPNCKELLNRLNFIKKNNGRYAMVDIIPTGWTALQTLREENKDLILHAHRCMHSALTRDPKHGVSIQVITKLSRLIGLDQIHIGTIVGKMYGNKEEVFQLRDICTSQRIKEDNKLFILEQDWINIKQMFPVASGGLNPLHIPELIKLFNKDIILQFGGGIHAHPQGTLSGAKAVRQSLEASLENIKLDEKAQNNKELKIALERWKK